jgi:hypothetical protein
MKPTEQQKSELKNYLREGLKYRETNSEVYDHLLSAVESMPDGLPFQQAINQVIDSDFGGPEKLPVLEKSCQALVAKQVTRQYWRIFFSYFQPRIIFLPITLLVAGYYVTRNNLINPIYLVGTVFLQYLLIAAFLIPYRYYKEGYIFGDSQASVKDKIFERIIGLPINLFVFIALTTVLSDKPGFEWLNIAEPYLTDLAMVALVIHSCIAVNLKNEKFELNLIA